jgi:hypothetical protein
VPAACRKGVQQGADNSPRPFAAQAQDCSIKGNIAKSGERIYHVPGGEFYNRTKIDQGAGALVLLRGGGLELKALKDVSNERPKRQSSRGAGSASASS